MPENPNECKYPQSTNNASVTVSRTVLLLPLLLILFPCKENSDNSEHTRQDLDLFTRTKATGMGCGACRRGSRGCGWRTRPYLVKNPNRVPLVLDDRVDDVVVTLVLAVLFSYMSRAHVGD